MQLGRVSTSFFLLFVSCLKLNEYISIGGGSVTWGCGGIWYIREDLEGISVGGHCKESGVKRDGGT